MGIGIKSLGVYVPENRVSNDDLSKLVDTSDEWIVDHTGIKSRYISLPEQATSDLALKACEEALAKAEVTPDQIDLIIAATATGDYPGFPTVACILQEKLKAKTAGAMDLAAGCTGFIYALETARCMVAAGAYSKVMIVGAETLSKIVDWNDRDTCVLFGDGAGAAVVQELPGDSGVIRSILRSDGRGAEYLKRPAGGSRLPYKQGVTDPKDFYLTMDGRKVYNFAVGANYDLVELFLQTPGIDIDKIKYIVPHQANIRIIQAAAKRLKLPEEKFYVNIQEYANTSAASIPLALAEMEMKGLLNRGDIILTIGFGAGLTYGGNLIRW